VAVTASSAAMFLWMTLDETTTIAAIAASRSPATASDAMISTNVKAR
jgi:hypothetical protein